MEQLPWLFPALALGLGYLLGSIPFGVILTRLFGAGDLRQIGSGNIGATNVLRTGRKGLAAGTLLLDGLKGAVAVLIAARLGEGLGVVGAVGAFLGHLFPVWLGFRGGKGVATMLGVSLALAWPVGLGFAATWLGTLALTRISSASGMTAALAAPAIALALGHREIAIALFAMAVILIWKHRENIGRLLNGTEPRVGQKAGASDGK
jgi:acyl phosphate:glycerol-3-phosphate acyltransferase